MAALSDHEIRAEIYRQFQVRLPRVGLELESFVADQCAYFGIDERKCRRFIAFAQQEQQSELRGMRQSAAQDHADAIGATKVKALETLMDAMEAGRFLLDKDGSLRMDPNGKPIFQANWGARIRAAENVCQIYGMYAPKQVQLEANHTHAHTHDISDEDLRNRLAAAIGARIVDVEFTPLAEPEAGGAAASRRIGATPGGDGLLLLFEESDGNG